MDIGFIIKIISQNNCKLRIKTLILQAQLQDCEVS